MMKYLKLLLRLLMINLTLTIQVLTLHVDNTSSCVQSMATALILKMPKKTEVQDWSEDKLRRRKKTICCSPMQMKTATFVEPQ